MARKSMYVLKRTKYVLTGMNKKVDDKIIVFSCFNGKSYTCSPKAIYEYMLTDKRYKDYNFIWFFNDTKKYEFLCQNKNTKIIKKTGISARRSPVFSIFAPD